jgi:prepilin-type N-terminal cleavage/methylation domain-containing protein
VDSKALQVNFEKSTATKNGVCMKTSNPGNRSGFTLVELLVVVAIVAILAAIAIPQFAAYRKRGFQASVKSDLKNAAVAQEAYYAAFVRYQNATPASSANLPGFEATDRVTVSVSVPTATQFALTATHANCGATVWSYDSVTGVVSNESCP